jgi:hypothetical protein
MRDLLQLLKESKLEEWTPAKTAKQGGFSIPSEYETMFGKDKAVLRKDGKKWVLDYKGETHKLPKKGSFGHAEKIVDTVNKAAKKAPKKAPAKKTPAKAPIRMPKAAPKAPVVAPAPAQKPKSKHFQRMLDIAKDAPRNKVAPKPAVRKTKSNACPPGEMMVFGRCVKPRK